MIAPRSSGTGMHLGQKMTNQTQPHIFNLPEIITYLNRQLDNNGETMFIMAYHHLGSDI